MATTPANGTVTAQDEEVARVARLQTLQAVHSCNKAAVLFPERRPAWAGFGLTALKALNNLQVPATRHMNGHIYYHARVCTGDHKRFANLPRYAVKVLVEVPSNKRSQATSIVVKLAGTCLERRFALNDFVKRVTETDLIFMTLPPREPMKECDYQDENGRVWIIGDLTNGRSGKNTADESSRITPSTAA